MKISLERDALLAQLQSVSGRLDPQRDPGAVRGAARRLADAASSAPPISTSASASRSRPRSPAREPSSSRPGCLLDVVRSLPAAAVSLELRPAEQDVELVSGNATFHIRTLRAEDFPPFPELDPNAVQLPAAPFVETATEGCRLGLARRDPPRAHGHPRLGLRARGADGRHRLLPPERQGDAARHPAAAGFEVNVPARALQELARLAGHAEDE